MAFIQRPDAPFFLYLAFNAVHTPKIGSVLEGRPHDLLFWRMGEHMAVRRGDWKLVPSPEGPLNGRPPDLADAGLYDLANDVAEQEDRAADHPDIARELAAAWQRWNHELPPPGWLPNPRPPPMP